MESKPTNKTQGAVAVASSELLAASCDFHEPYFGASYPDACCIEGNLWDEDSYDAADGLLHSGGEVPCPQCNHEAWVNSFDDELGNQGYIAADKGQPREYKHKKVRHEQPGDEAKLREWWLAGYDQCVSEANAANAEVSESAPTNPKP